MVVKSNTSWVLSRVGSLQRLPTGREAMTGAIDPQVLFNNSFLCRSREYM
jgi:hypothetical protein